MLIAGFIFAEMRHHSYLNSAKKIIESYKGNKPFSFFLKKYFGANKKHGSKDRKQIATLCYNFYRLGKAMPDGLVEEKFFTGTFLCEHTHNHFLHFHKPEWNELIGKPLTEKISFLDFKFENVFPGGNELSDGIDHKQYCLSFFDQPDLFLRIRPGKKNMVLKKLQEAGFKFEMLVPPALDEAEMQSGWWTGGGIISQRQFPDSGRLDALRSLDAQSIENGFSRVCSGHVTRWPFSRWDSKTAQIISMVVRPSTALHKG